MKYDFVLGSEVSEIQAQKLRIIDSKVYSQDLMVGTSLIHKFHKRNPNIYIMAIDTITKQPVGYISCIPLQRGTLKQTYTPGFNEENLNLDTIVRPEFTRSFDLFFSSIVVDPGIKDKPQVVLGMARKFIAYMTKIMLAGNFPKEAAAHAVSIEGARICEKMNMIKTSALSAGGVLYHSHNISRYFFYKNIGPEAREKIRDLIIKRMVGSSTNDF